MHWNEWRLVRIYFTHTNTDDIINWLESNMIFCRRIFTPKTGKNDHGARDENQPHCSEEKGEKICRCSRNADDMNAANEQKREATQFNSFRRRNRDRNWKKKHETHAMDHAIHRGPHIACDGEQWIDGRDELRDLAASSSKKFISTPVEVVFFFCFAFNLLSNLNGGTGYVRSSGFGH